MRPQPFLAGSSLIAATFALGWWIPVQPPVPGQETRPVPAHTSSPPAVSFAGQVQPLLEKRCQPCHFAGGKMYESLPFDRPETIYTLGEKLFTRIPDQREQALLRAFLAQGAAPHSR